jgi:ATP-binding cassette subfamily B protein
MYPRALASAQRIDELLDERADVLEPDRPAQLAKVRGAYQLRDVGFAYEGTSEPALSGITFDVPAGGVTGIVGPTGSGKTTLLLLLGRLFDATRGELLLDGVPIKSLPIATVRDPLGYVPQDSFLFSEPYRDNVAFGIDGELPDLKLAEVVEMACMTEEVARFPDGFDQLIGERGVTLSGGQRQRTCIARALAKDPVVLVLDDALSAVDTETETRLIDNLRRAGSGRTVVIAAHRLSSVARADQIVVLRRDGTIEAIGKHADLVARDGWYRDTWQRQQAQDELSVL